MDALGTMLFVLLVSAWIWPERFGKWLGAVERGRRRALSDTGDR